MFYRTVYEDVICLMIAVNNFRSSKLVYFLLFIAFLISSRCWIGFDGRGTLFFYSLPVALLVLILLRKCRFRHQARYAVFSFLIYMARVYTMCRVKGSLDLLGMCNQAVLPFTIYLILCLEEREKESVLFYITKWMGWILIPGIIIYLISFLVTLPSFGIIQTDYGGNFYGDPCFNYLFYIRPVTVGATGMYRFNGPLIEPGDLGCVSAFLLFATRFDFKRFKYLWAVFVSLILTFSLAGYLLTLFGYAAILMTQNKLSVSKLLIGLIIVLIVIIFGTYYNGGDNYVNNSILSRLQDEELSLDSTNGRLSSQKLEYYYSMFDNPSLLLFGYDKNTMSYLNDEFGAGAGFYSIVLSIGFFGVLLYVLPYLYLTLITKNRRYALLFLVFFVLYLYQRFDLFWISIILCYSYGLSISEKIDQNL